MVKGKHTFVWGMLLLTLNSLCWADDELKVAHIQTDSTHYQAVPQNTQDMSTPTFSVKVEHTGLPDKSGDSDYWKTSFGGRTIIIDNRVRYLGMSLPDEATTQSRITPTLKFPFTVTNRSKGQQATLTIGYIEGINTREAHRLGQSNKDYISSPVVIKLNGQKVHYLSTNGQDIRIRIPAYLINKNGVNILQIESGYYFPARNEVAYDLIRLKDLALNL